MNGNVNKLNVSRSADGSVRIDITGKHADPSFMETVVNCCLLIDFSAEFIPQQIERIENEQGVMRTRNVGASLRLEREKFPSVEAYVTNVSGKLQSSHIFNAKTSSLFPGVPTGLWPWSRKDVVVPVTDSKPWQSGRVQ
jgi:hypothetical protein